MAKVKKHITENEDRLLRELRAVTDGQLDDDVIGALLEQARSQRAASSVAFYVRDGVSIEEWTEQNFGAATDPSDFPDDEPADQIIIDFEEE